MEIRETLSEFQSTHSETLKKSLLESFTELEDDRQKLMREVFSLGQSFDTASTDEARLEILKKIRGLMLKKNFLNSLIQTIDSTLNPSEF